MANVLDINVGDVNKFIDGLEEIFAGQRERHVDDSVCGLCEYDGAYIGQSGDWCNECPGFDRDDCFKLSDKYRKKWIDTITNSLPSAQPEFAKDKNVHSNDCVSRQAAIDAVRGRFSMPVDNLIVEVIGALPSVEVEPTEEQIKKYILDHNLTHKVFEPVKSGRWMWNADVRCSRCGHKLQTTGLPSYCPNCGAKMEGADHE